ncbi:hypothetical protein [Streptomyces sp. NPDC005955]
MRSSMCLFRPDPSTFPAASASSKEIADRVEVKRLAQPTPRAR